MASGVELDTLIFSVGLGALLFAGLYLIGTPRHLGGAGK